MDKIPDQIGYLVLTEDGAVLESGGELENDERVATIITDLITLSNKWAIVLNPKIDLQSLVVLTHLVLLFYEIIKFGHNTDDDNVFTLRMLYVVSIIMFIGILTCLL